MARSGTRERTPARWDDFLGRFAVRSAQVLLVLLLGAVAVWALREISLVVIPVIIALILAAAVSPVVARLTRAGIPNGLASFLALLLGLGSFALIVWFVVRAIRAEWEELAGAAGEGFDRLQEWLIDGPIGIEEQQITELREQATDLLTGDTVQEGAVAGATAALEVATGTVLAIVVLFFLLRDHRKIWAFFLRPLSPASRDRADRIGYEAVQVGGGYMRGIVLIAFVDAFFIGLALFILGIPLALPLAVLVFVGAFIPILGATLAGTFATLVALVSDGPVTALIVLGVVIAVNQLEGNLLEPVVMGRTLHLHPLAILLALTAGTILSGIVGALLAVPIAAVAWTVVSQWNADPDEGSADGWDGGPDDGPERSEGEPPAARGATMRTGAARDAVADD
jgi:putative heme transporter